MRRSALFGLLLSVSAARADAPATPPGDAIAGTWSYDAALSSPQADAGDGTSATPSSAGAGHHHGGGAGGASGGGGMGGHGSGHGGGHHGGDHAAPATTSGASTKEDLAERSERGLSRMFAKNVTITPLKQRIRLDDGDHVVELDRDGMNVSGPGVGGTVALTDAKPDVVIQTLTIRVHSRVRHAAQCLAAFGTRGRLIKTAAYLAPTCPRPIRHDRSNLCDESLS